MIHQQFKTTLTDKKLIRKGDSVLVCVSGGPDSIALLHLLSDLRKSCNIKLFAAHLDHMIRGKQSANDAKFVQKVSSELDLPLISEKINVKTIAMRRKMSIEEAAREARYEFYKRAAKKLNAQKIATGHTWDDQAETVLMRLIKGSGSMGLSGIPYKRKLEKAIIIRPLLDIRRRDIEKYLKKHSFPSRIDASNFKTCYLRNKIRRILIPLMEKEFNPRVKDSLNLISKNMRDEYDYLSAAAAHTYRRICLISKNRVEVGVKKLVRQHVALRRLIVRQIIHFLKGDLKRITFKHWQEIESMLVTGGKAGIDLPGRIRVAKQGKLLIFTLKYTALIKPIQLRKAVKINIPGEAAIPELGVRFKSNIAASAPRFRKGVRKKGIEYVNGDAVNNFLKIRTRRKGDRMRPLGMKSYKKLHDIFVDEKVPLAIRDRIPLVISGKDILWAVGVKLSEDYKVRVNNGRIIKLEVNPMLTK